MAKSASAKRNIATAVKIALVLVPVWSFAGWGQTPLRQGNESDFKDWQPTRGQVSTEERAAGVRPSPAQRNAEDRELQQLNQDLMRQEQPSSPTQPTAPK
jgi:hypothetical protein